MKRQLEILPEHFKRYELYNVCGFLKFDYLESEKTVNGGNGNEYKHTD